ncbi:Ger(x)C family spore germination protein [Paenibacillus arenilitoris]|uniref:Ger(X)C family spore germination protein n=1 Tax=Paenibacillus arenilitoris TaxID=2772299 RepID=A0A927CS14_9BACL|nr:Ger(x)C family spore germination protein [Paenibacillus arenilitoris]MBD2870565.1 Ger(x)C family spore germination protein [Paenibacillus arenilitoris]
MLSKLTILALCLLMLTGCWSRRELNDILVVLGAGIDWEEGEYLVSFQVVNPSEISTQRKSADRPPVTLYQGKGKTLFEAARSLTAEAPRKVYMGHLQLYVLSEEIARRGLNDVVDNMLRDNEFRMDFNLVVAKGTSASDILKLYTPLEKLPTNNMLQSLETSEKSWAPSVSIMLDEVLDKLSNDGTELALTGIQLIGDPNMGESKKNVEVYHPPSRFRYTGIAAFKGDKLVSWLNENESKGYTDITDNLDSTSIELACGERDYMGIEIISSNAKIETKLRSGKPEVAVSIRSEANIVDRSCKSVDLTDPEAIKRLEEEAAKQLRSHAEAAVKKAKRLKSDILGFGNQLGKDYPEYWKTVKDSWNERYFPQTEVTYNIKLMIRKTGTTGNSTLKHS